MEGNYPGGMDAPKSGHATAYSCGLCYKEFTHYRDLAAHERWHLEQMNQAGVLPTGQRPAFDNRPLYSGTAARDIMEKATQPFRSEADVHMERTATVERPHPYRPDTGVRLPVDTRAVTPVCETIPTALGSDLHGLSVDSRTLSTGTVMSTHETVPAQLPVPTPTRLAVQTSPLDSQDSRSSHSTPTDAHTLSYNTSQYLESFKTPLTLPSHSPLYSAHPLIRHDDVFGSTEPRNVLPKMDSQIYPNPDPYYSLTKHLAGSTGVEKVESPIQPAVSITPPTTMSAAQLAYYQHVRARQEKESSPNLASYNNSPVMQSPRLSSTESAEAHLPKSPEPQVQYYAQPVSKQNTGTYVHPDQSRQAPTPTGSVSYQHPDQSKPAPTQTETVPYLHHDQSRHVSTPSAYLNQDLGKPVSASNTSSISYLHQDFSKQVSTPTSIISYLPHDISKHVISTQSSVPYLPQDISKQVSIPSSVTYLAHDITKHMSPPVPMSHIPKQVYTPSTLSYVPHSLLDRQDSIPSAVPLPYVTEDMRKHVSTPNTMPYIAHDISRFVSTPSTIYLHHSIGKPLTAPTIPYSHNKSVTATSTLSYIHDSITKHASIPSTMPYVHNIGKPVAAPSTISYLPHDAIKQMPPTQLPPYAYMPVAIPEEFQLATAAQDYATSTDSGSRIPPSTTVEHSVLSLIQAHTALSQQDSTSQAFGLAQPRSIPPELDAQPPGGFKAFKQNKSESLGKNHESLVKSRPYPGGNTLPQYSDNEAFVRNDQYTQSTPRANLPIPGASSMMEHSEENNLNCHYCSMTFQTVKDLTAHLVIHKQEGRLMEKINRPETTNLSNPNSYNTQNAFTMGKDLILHAADGASSVDASSNKICSICSKSFQNQIQLSEHMHTHSADKTFTCTVCHKAFATKSRCVRHELIHKRTDGLIHCEVCDKGFQNKGTYLYHIKNHDLGDLDRKNTQNFEVPQSNSSATDYSNVKGTAPDNEDHNASHFDDLIKLSLEHMEEFKADKSKSSFIDQQIHGASNPPPYFQHVSSETSESIYQDQGQNLTAGPLNFSLEENLVECPVCESEMDKCALIEHMASHSLHTCQQCERAFVEKSEYVEHLMTFHWKDLVDQSDDETRNASGDSPLKSIDDKSNVGIKKEPEVSHAAVDNNPIRETIKALLQKKPVMTSKPKEMPVYNCSECDITFTFKGEFQKHELAHRRDARSVACAICDMSFYEKANYLYHMHEHAQEQDDDSEENETTDDSSPESISLVNCFTCHKSMERGKLVDHMKVHTKYACYRCQKAFSHRRNYVQHLKSAHNEVVNDENLPKVEVRPAKREKIQSATSEDTLHNCEICSQTFDTRGKLNKHVASHSKKRKPVSTCEICKEDFYNKGTFLYHLRKHETTDLGELTKQSEQFVEKMGLFPKSTNVEPDPVAENVVIHDDVAGDVVDEYAEVNLDSIDSGITSDEGDLEDRVLHSKDVEDETITVHQYLDEKTGDIIERISHVDDRPGNGNISNTAGNDHIQEGAESLTEAQGICKEVKSDSDKGKECTLKSVGKENPNQTTPALSNSKSQPDDLLVVDADSKIQTHMTTDRRAKSQDLHRGIVNKELLSNISIADIRECDICKKHIVKTVYIDHLKIHKVHECDTCKKSFTQKRGYTYHMKAVHCSELLEPGADKDFNKEEAASFSGSKKGHNVKSKIVKHSKKDTSLMCLICSITCIDKDAFSKHSEMHESEKLVCPVCAKEFTKRNSLVLHEATHDFGARSKKGLPYPSWCPLCKITIQSHRHYVDHSRVHTSERPYKCPECNHDFTRRHNLETHLKKHRAEKSAESTKDLVKNKFAKNHRRMNKGHSNSNNPICKPKRKYKKKKSTIGESAEMEHVRNVTQQQKRSRRINYNEKAMTKKKPIEDNETRVVKTTNRSRRSIKLINYNEDELIKKLETDTDSEPSDTEQKYKDSKSMSYGTGKRIEIEQSSEGHHKKNVPKKQKATRNVKICKEEMNKLIETQDSETDCGENVSRTRRALKRVTYNEKKMAKRIKIEDIDETGHHKPDTVKINVSPNDAAYKNDQAVHVGRKRTATAHNISYNERELTKKNKMTSADNKTYDQTSSRLKRKASDPVKYIKNVKVKKREASTENNNGRKCIYNKRGKNKLRKIDMSASKKKMAYMIVRKSRRIQQVDATSEIKLKPSRHIVHSTRKVSNVMSKPRGRPIKTKILKQSVSEQNNEHALELGLKLNYKVNWIKSPQGQLYPKQCPQCCLLIRAYNHYIEHSRVHTGIRPYQCKICNHAFSAERYRDRHEKTCKAVKCPNKETKIMTNKDAELRGTKFANTEKSSERKTQMSEQMKNKRMNPEVLVVDINSSFTNSSLSEGIVSPDRTRTSTKTEILPFTCETCGKAFKKKRDLYIHAKDHIADDQYSQLTAEYKGNPEHLIPDSQGNGTSKSEIKSEVHDNTTLSDSINQDELKDAVNKVEENDIDTPSHDKNVATTSLETNTGTGNETSDVLPLDPVTENKSEAEETPSVSDGIKQIAKADDQCNTEKLVCKGSLVEIDKGSIVKVETVKSAEMLPSCSNSDDNSSNHSTESAKDAKSLKVKKLSSESALSKWKTKVHAVLSSQLELNDKRLRAANTDKNSKPGTNDGNESVDRNTEPSKFECRICGEIIDIEDEFISHMDVHLHEMPPYCHICDIYFMAIYPKRRLTEHNKKKHNDRKSE